MYIPFILIQIKKLKSPTFFLLFCKLDPPLNIPFLVIMWFKKITKITIPPPRFSLYRIRLNISPKEGIIKDNIYYIISHLISSTGQKLKTGLSLEHFYETAWCKVWKYRQIVRQNCGVYEIWACKNDEKKIKLIYFGLENSW